MAKKPSKPPQKSIKPPIPFDSTRKTEHYRRKKFSDSPILKKSKNQGPPPLKSKKWEKLKFFLHRLTDKNTKTSHTEFDRNPPINKKVENFTPPSKMVSDAMG